MRLAYFTNVTKTVQTLLCCAVMAIRANCKASLAGESQGVIECVLKQTFKYWLTQIGPPGPGSEWKMPRCTQVVIPGQCNVG